MELRLERATRLPRPRWWFVALFAVWIAWILLASASFGGGADARPLCHFRALTGVPCVGCGGSTGARAILDGQPERAFDLNPGLFFLLTVWLALFVRRLVTGRRIVARFSPRGRKVAWSVAAVLFAVAWAYVIWRQGRGA
ncbi:MAG: DUF2752 domain-containing protein [Planctomycetota bacterium]|nr:DUF2752 domain-containing protein [Planctomycetota bacterium]